MRKRWNDTKLVLADCVDYFGGTSAGGIIATGLAIGMPISRMEELYSQEVPRIFRHARIWRMNSGLHERHPVVRMLKQEYGETTTLGSDKVRTLLLLCMRNANTDSPWPISNNPAALFNDPALGSSNLKLPIWQLVRASSAAPLFFPPEEIRLADRRFLFVDGALTPFNNPALQLYLMATQPAYRLAWQRGEDKILLISIGTGSVTPIDRSTTFRRANVFSQLRYILPALMNGMSVQQDVLCRTLGRCRQGDPIDMELGDLSGPADGLREFTYARINVELSRDGLLDLLRRLPNNSEYAEPLERLAARADKMGLGRLNRAANAPALALIGKALGQVTVTDALFEGFLP